jgi:peptide/nickel transport system ATP-binding protein
VTTPVPAEPVLSVTDLTASFRTSGEWRAVVRRASFNVSAREIVAIVGESGSGKSVTALSVMRLIPQSKGRVEGSVRLSGTDLLKLPEAEMRGIRGAKIAMIFQEPMTSLNPLLTIGRQISESLTEHRGMSRTEADAETLRLLDRVRIPAARSRFGEYPHRFSGGMRQRVMIAMALACRPKLLIADEPTTALDVTIQAQILELIKEIQDQEDMSVLFITHDMGVVAEIAHRTLVMLDGEIVEQRATEDIFAQPRHPYTRALLSAVPRLGAMAGHARPMRFAVVNRLTGEAEAAREMPDTTVNADRPVLAVNNLVTRFDVRSGFFGSVSARIHAVENVSFDLRRGETLALVGESGCGKSTTGKSILRLVEATSGSISIDGEDMLAVKGAALQGVRRKAQMIFQDPFASLNPRMKVGAAIAQPILVHGLASRAAAREKVASLLERVGLPRAAAERFPDEFSGGQRQRICIARALALEPKLIVADESVSALDVSIKAQVINLLLDLQSDQQLAYLFISHDMSVVERVAHRVAVMYLGEIVEIGPRCAVFENPQHPYTKRLLAAVPIPDPATRNQFRAASNDEVKSPIRTPDYVPPMRRYLEIADGHRVQVWGPEWDTIAAS